MTSTPATISFTTDGDTIRVELRTAPREAALTKDEAEALARQIIADIGQAIAAHRTHVGVHLAGITSTIPLDDAFTVAESLLEIVTTSA